MLNLCPSEKALRENALLPYSKQTQPAEFLCRWAKAGHGGALAGDNGQQALLFAGLFEFNSADRQ